MLPNPDTHPARCFQHLDVVPITLNGSVQFGSPPFSIRRRPRCVHRAAMPETSVDEHCDSDSGKNDVGRASQVRQRSNVLTKSEPPTMQR